MYLVMTKNTWHDLRAHTKCIWHDTNNMTWHQQHVSNRNHVYTTNNIWPGTECIWYIHDRYCWHSLYFCPSLSRIIRTMSDIVGTVLAALSCDMTPIISEELWMKCTLPIISDPILNVSDNDQAYLTRYRRSYCMCLTWHEGFLRNYQEYLH